MLVLGCQSDIAWEDKTSNLSTIRRLLDEAQPPSGALVALPEMFATGFSMRADAMAEPMDGPIARFLADEAAARGIWLLGGAAMQNIPGRPQNQALVFDATGRLATAYAKIKPFSPGEETTHYASGAEIQLFEWEGIRVCPLICYDLRFPELFRAAARKARPELFVVIANFPAQRIQHWVRLLQARAIENQAYVLGVNRVGKDPQTAYGGRSLIADPQGDIVADAGTEAGWVRAALDISALRRYRSNLPFLDDLSAVP
jgi:predicted amidohydrolase